MLLFLGYSVAVSWAYVCKLKQACSIEESANRLIIWFKKDEAIPSFSEDFKEFQQNTLARLGDSNTLLITGYFGENENNTTIENNLGIARAKEVKGLFTTMEPRRIEVEGVLLDSLPVQGIFNAVKIRILTKTRYVKELPNGAILYVGDSLPQELPKPLDAVLEMVAIENRRNVIEVVAHAYSKPSEGENFELALQLAMNLKEILVKKGLNPRLINASSRGETEPMDMASVENRVEILISE